MTDLTYASIGDLAAWAKGIMVSRAPDFVIGDDYLERWFVVPRNQLQNVYLHRFRRSDIDRALHDHPWENTSIVLAGGYIEHMPSGQALRGPGDVVRRNAEDAHRIELFPETEAISLFVTGPKIRDWGFHCPAGWVPWQAFLDPNDSSRIGAGCGENGDA